MSSGLDLTLGVLERNDVTENKSGIVSSVGESWLEYSSSSTDTADDLDFGGNEFLGVQSSIDAGIMASQTEIQWDFSSGASSFSWFNNPGSFYNTLLCNSIFSNVLYSGIYCKPFNYLEQKLNHQIKASTYLDSDYIVSCGYIQYQFAKLLLVLLR